MPKFPAIVRQLRVHQWVKNLLVFVPLIAAHRIDQGPALLGAFKAFLAFSFTASAIYVMNDVFDLKADRAHPTKRHRPLASGEIPVATAISVALILCFAGFTLMMGVSMRATTLLLAYVVLNASYSRSLKEVAIVDVLLLASFYTIRILIGGAVTQIVLTPWLLAFSMFIFFSLALAKRVSELQGMIEAKKDFAKRRGYRVSDLDVLTIMGACAGQLAVLVFAMYINSDEMVRMYRNPEALWYLCLAIFYWNTRIWLKVHRGEMHEDPIVFAIRDRSSYVVAAFGALVLILATGTASPGAP